MAKVAASVQEQELVEIWLRPLDKEGTGEVDQSVTVTVNGKEIKFNRGETALVPPEAYIILKESGRFPELR